MNKLIFALLAILLLACGSTDTEAGKDTTSVSKSEKPVTDFVEYYKSGAVKIRGQEQDGKRVGKWQSFYPNGYKWSESEYKNGFREGPIVVYYENGIMRYDGRYYNDERTGTWQFYDTTGVRIKKIDMDVVVTVPDSLFTQ